MARPDPRAESVASAFRSGDLAGARAGCESALADAPGPAAAPFHFWLGAVASREGHWDAARAHYRRALALSPGEALWQFQAGLAAFQLGDLESAEAHYQEAIRLQPTYPVALYNLGVLRQARGDLDGARLAYESALAQQPRFPEALTNLGNTLAAAGALAGAARAYEMAIAQSPGMVAAHHGLGLARLRLGHLAEAAVSLAQAVALAPGHVQAWLELADCRMRMQDALGALAAVDAVLARDPENETARFLRAQYAGGRVAAAPAAHVQRLFDNMAPTFDLHLTGALRYDVPRALVARLLPWLQAFAAARGRKPDVIDLGCGTGLFGEAIAPHAGALTGVDLSAAMLDRARRRQVYSVLVQGDATDHLAGCPACADLIAATDVLIYVGAVEALFAAAAAALAPGGRLALSIEAPAGLEEDFRLLPSGRFAHRPAYLARVALSCGLATVDEVETVIRLENGLPLAGRLMQFARA